MVRLSYKKRDKDHFNLSYKLIDIDECYEETDGCQQECINTNGSYYCVCRIGYRLTSDGYSCEGSYKLRYIIIIIVMLKVLPGVSHDNFRC